MFGAKVSITTGVSLTGPEYLISPFSFILYDPALFTLSHKIDNVSFVEVTFKFLGVSTFCCGNVLLIISTGALVRSLLVAVNDNLY